MAIYFHKRTGETAQVTQVEIPDPQALLLYGRHTQVFNLFDKYRVELIIRQPQTAKPDGYIYTPGDDAIGFELKCLDGLPWMISGNITGPSLRDREIFILLRDKCPLLYTMTLKAGPPYLEILTRSQMQDWQQLTPEQAQSLEEEVRKEPRNGTQKWISRMLQEKDGFNV